MGVKLKTIWKNKFKILEGIKNTLFPTQYVEKIASHRLAICQSNVCGFYDEKGVMEITVLKGKPACGGCGCNVIYKTHTLSGYCYLQDIGKLPLWDVEMTEKEEEAWRNKTGIKNE